jgi:hypothetical protein
MAVAHIIASQELKFSLYFSGSCIPINQKLSYYCHLGVIIDEHLLWNHQIQNTVTKASKGIGMMRRIKQFVPKSTLVKIYNAIVFPTLIIVAWFGITVVIT